MIDPTTRPPGKPRSVALVIILSILTVGIYGIYWTYVNYEEIRRWRGTGVDGRVGVLLNVIIVGAFLMPSYIGRMYYEDFLSQGDEPLLALQRVPITGFSGFLVLIPLIGWISWQASIQSKLNNFWERQADTAKAAARPAGRRHAEALDSGAGQAGAS